MWYKNVGITFFHFVTQSMRLTDRQTERDRRTEMPWKYRALHRMQTCSRTIKTIYKPSLTHQNENDKLIRRWDSERELSLRRHRTRTTKYIDSCINSATDRRGYVLERRFTKFSEITQCNGHYPVQGHPRSLILAPIESSYTTCYKWLILT